ncbi:MAG TPA: hypothetical protein VN380_14420 [Thermoanaerobaculia bacterium]|nr:hypothetical protein [Thermoanaerobaculia bacterium]
MSKRVTAVALLLVALSSPLLAAPRRDDGDQPSRSAISRLITRIVHALDDFELTWPRP